jgi:hypothetical protein
MALSSIELRAYGGNAHASNRAGTDPAIDGKCDEPPRIRRSEAARGEACLRACYRRTTTRITARSPARSATAK